MTKEKETSWLNFIGMLYLCAITIGSLIGTLAFFATFTFFAFEATFVLLRKIGTAIMGAL